MSSRRVGTFMKIVSFHQIARLKSWKLLYEKGKVTSI